MTTVDPTTSLPLPDSAIQRVLFVAENVHVYQIPPLTSTKGFSASSWTSPTAPTAQQIFTARIRIIETSIESNIKSHILLEDGKTGDLFAAAPYTSTAVVQSALDSSRFFAVRVQGEGGMKATLGIGFEDRSPAFDFSISLGEVRKVLGMEGAVAAAPGKPAATTSTFEKANKQDFSLKDGQSIHVEFGGKGQRAAHESTSSEATKENSTALFSIAPPPSAAKSTGNAGFVAHPSASEAKRAEDFGFDDGEFGEFQ